MNEHHFPLQETLQAMYFTALENEPMQMFVSGYISSFLMCWVFMRVGTALLIIKFRTFSTIVQRKRKAGSYICGLPVMWQLFPTNTMSIQIKCFQTPCLLPPSLSPQANLSNTIPMIAK